MTHHASTVFATAAALLSISGTAYYLLCIWSAALFRRDCRRQALSSFAPPVSILKPLKGSDPGIYESFSSHCLLDYPEYEIIFGVSDPADPAAAAVRRLQQEFPQRSIRLVVCPRTLGANIKVSNLAQMLGEARYDHLVVNDSDIRVPGDYLRQVVAPLSSDRVGMVTCLYRGVPAPTLGSRLESLGISTDFCGGVLAARFLENGIQFGLGSTLAFRRRELQAIGGFESCLDYLADDYELGNRIHALGFKVLLAPVSVDTFLPAYDWTAFFRHQLRWARSVRDTRRWGYVGVLLTFGLPWALLNAFANPHFRWTWQLLALVLTLRLLMALSVGGGVLRDRFTLRLLWLVPVRDVIALLVWIASFAGNQVAWRGDSFALKDGKLARISP